MNISLSPSGDFLLSSEDHSVTVPCSLNGLIWLKSILRARQMGITKLGSAGSPTQFDIDQAVKGFQIARNPLPHLETELDL